jgi:CHAT domain-containing protein
MLSTIELDKGNISQSAIWMRRAVIGTLVDKAAGSEEIADVLTAYANFQTRTRRLLEADTLFRKLDPIYEKTFAHHSPKYLFYKSRLLGNLTALGNFSAAEFEYKILRDNMASADIIANSVREEEFFQGLYQLARTSTPNGNNPIVERLKTIVSQYPDFLKQPRDRIVFSYFALYAGDVDLADKFITAVENTAPLNEQFSAYESIIKSFIAARRGKYDESIAMVSDALDRIRLFHKQFENESSSRLPAITIEERLILSLILSFNAPHASTFDKANILFQLNQYLNRDKGKLGLNARAGRQALKYDLQREDIRSRDRLQDLRDRLMEEGTDALLARAMPIRNYTPGKTNDYGPLIRLEEIEDKIVSADDQLKASVPDFLNGSADSTVDLGSVQRLLKPNEVLVLHEFSFNSFVTTCVKSDGTTTDNRALDVSEIQQFVNDLKSLAAAVHLSNAPSVGSDNEFPGESSHRVYQLFFGRIEACLKNKTHILLATDPDFFSVPWNALLTVAPSKDHKFNNRDAAWFPKSYSLSLLPSVRSLFQLRTNLPPSKAKENFLGIGAPNLKGTPDPSKQIALAPLFVARGVANRTAIADLPALPETADELRNIARVLGASNSKILLGSNATERELRMQPLNDYRVISFATHAVVAGEIEGITEPALVLTPGAEANDPKNDGLLTAPEIANLTLDANLVILSACNTAAADGRASG